MRNVPKTNPEAFQIGQDLKKAPAMKQELLETRLFGVKR
jgi:hypothetical protein